MLYMKSLSGLIIIMLFLSQFNSQAQSISGVLDIDVSKLSFKKQRVNPLDADFTFFNFRFNKLPTIDGINTFSAFNRTTGLNDTFIITNGSFEYSTSTLVIENTFFNPKIDSFNPNGATDFGNAIVSGLLSLIWN